VRPSVVRPAVTRLRGLVGPVRVRVTLAAASVALVIGSIGAVLFAYALHNDLETTLIASARQQVETITAQLAEGSSPQLAAVTARDDVITQVVSPDGVIVGTDHPGLADPLLTSPGVATGMGVPGLADHYVVVAERADDGTLVVVAHSNEQVAHAHRTTILLLGFFVPGALATLAVAVWAAVGQALRPVEAMRRQAALITATDLGQRLSEPPGTDELTLLSRTLNEMLDRIDASQRAQRQFLSDASHELRSPLAVLRQVAEVAARYPQRTDVVALSGEVLAEERRMEGLVTALLTLARLEGARSTGTQVLDLDDIVLGEVRRARVGDGPVIDASGVRAGQVLGDPVLLSRVVQNLLSNAVRHARSRVWVSVIDSGASVRLVVADDGAGIAPADRATVFGRFVRLDEARARDAGGSGLGLAIVAKVVASAEGTVRVDEAPGGGARFTIDLPGAGGAPGDVAPGDLAPQSVPEDGPVP
jgi:signal transduction histidine kinase